jgi:hypothetical protein
MSIRYCKLWFTTILVVLFLSSTSVLAAQAEQPSTEGLLGSVQSVLEERLTISPDEQIHSVEAISKTQYDEAGFITHIIWYKNQMIYREKSNLYDAAHRFIGTASYQQDGSFLQDSAYDYDKLGLLRQVRFLKPDGSNFLKKVFHYTPKGLVSQQLRFDSSDTLQGQDTFDYTTKGKLSATYHYDAKGALISKETYEYDKSGNINQECVYEGATNKSPLKTILYDTEGRKVSETNYAPSGVKTREFLCEYNAVGNKIKQIHYRGDGTKYAETRYNERGLPKTYLNYTADGLEECNEEYQYEYDAVGNWIKQTVTTCPNENNPEHVRPLEIIQRTIHYY